MKHLILMSLAFLAVAISSTARADENPGKTLDVERIDQTIAEWQPSEAERAFDRIGWASDLVEALQLAKQHRRPIFLFTYDGADLACFRC